MAFKFYLNDNEINVQTNASFRSTQDSSLDDGSLMIELTTSAKTIKPRSKLRIDEINGNNEVVNEWNFIVISDDVEQANKIEPFYYVHYLTVAQSTQALQHYLLRNSIFQQPLDEKKARTIAHGYILNTPTSTTTFDASGKMILACYNNGAASWDDWQENVYRSDKIYISSREKINNVFVDIDTWVLGFKFAYDNGTNGILCTMGNSPRTWDRNKHSSFGIFIEYREEEDSAEPDAQESFTINAGNGKYDTIIQQISKTFFEEHGAGWYNLTLNVQNLPSWIFNNSDISFNVTDDRTTGGVVGAAFPTIQTILYLTLRIDTYYYSLYNVLNNIRYQCGKELNGIDRQEKPYSLFNISELNNIVAPDFRFSGSTVFDAVSQVFEYIDAVPTLDKSNQLGYELLNEFNGQKLDSSTKFGDIKTRLEDKYYDNQIITQYTNAKQPTPIWYPAKNRYKYIETTKYGIPNVNDAVITTDKPIEKINKLWIRLSRKTDVDYKFDVKHSYIYNNNTYYIYSVDFSGFSIPNASYDIAPVMVEQSIYFSLPVGSITSSSRVQANTLMFTKGSKEIHVGTYEELNYTSINIYTVIAKMLREEWEFVNSWNIGDLFTPQNVFETHYSIEYMATYEGQTMVESPENKKEGQFVVAQNSSSTAINKMGSNMLGFITRTGNESKAITMQLNTYDSRLTKGSIWQDDNGNKWVANIVKITFTTSNEIITEVEFVKNFNMISQRTQVDEEIKYTTINQQLIDKGYENVNEYLYFSTSSISDDENTQFTLDVVNSLLKGTFGNDDTLSYVGDCMIRLDDNTPCFIPLHIYGAGNVINFEINYDHPLLAGNYLDGTQYTTMSRAVLYTDDGFGNELYAVFYKQLDNSSQLYDNYPIGNTSSHTQMFSLTYKYYKRENEILSFNYGIALLPKPIFQSNSYVKSEEIYFGEEFLAQNYLIPNNKYHTYQRILHLFFDTENEYGINDKKVKDSSNVIEETGLSTIVDTTNRYIQFSAGNVQYGQSAKSWGICDDNGNIYLVANQSVESSGGSLTTRLYFARRRKRWE